MATKGSIKKFNFKKNVSGDARNKEAGVTQYAGPKPKPGPYRVRLKRLFMDENKAGPSIRFLMEIAEPKGSKNEKYNGYGIWGGQNITDQGAGYVNQLILAIANGDEEVKDAFWEEGVKAREDDKGVYHVERIGDFKVGSPKCDIELIVTTKDDTYKGQTKLVTTSYVPIDQAITDDDDDDEDDGYMGEVDEDDDENYSDDESSDDEDDEDDEDLFDDEDDEDD